MSDLKITLQNTTETTCPITEKFACNLFSDYSAILLLYDKNVEKYARAILRTLKKNRKIPTRIFPEPVPAGENSKSLSMAQRIIEKYSDKLQKDSLIICVGGGMICDLGGFIAAIFMRGIDHILFPTTLLAQIDAAIGGKTAVNQETYKNIIGCFHHPKAVIIRHKWLSSLKKIELDSGWGELLKTAAINSSDFFNLVLNSFHNRPIPSEIMRTYILWAINTKITLVQKDFHDQAQRRLLNFGHTIGHAIESAAKYRIPHGICIMAGMALETTMGERQGLCCAKFAAGLRCLLKELAPFRSFINPDDVICYLKRDKKNYGKSVAFALLEKPGLAVKNKENYTVDIPMEKIDSIIIPLLSELLSNLK